MQREPKEERSSAFLSVPVMGSIRYYEFKKTTKTCLRCGVTIANTSANRKWCKECRKIAERGQRAKLALKKRG